MQLIQYLIGDLNYGGKLINIEDKEILKQTVSHFINQELIEGSGIITGGVYAKHYQITYKKKLFDLASEKIKEVSDGAFFANSNSTYGPKFERCYLMPAMIDTITHMQDHVKDQFPMDDLPQVFGLHKSATAKATTDIAADIMERTYKHQFVVKRSDTSLNVKIKNNKQTLLIYEYYR